MSDQLSVLLRQERQLNGALHSLEVKLESEIDEPEKGGTIEGIRDTRQNLEAVQSKLKSQGR